MVKEKMMKFLKYFMPAIAIIAILFAGSMYRQVVLLKRNPQTIALKETKDLVEKVSKLVVLPTDETPTIATVSDPSVLKDQPFFAKAEKGDKVLIYAQSKKAILYSVTLNKILDVAPLNIGTQNTASPKSVTPSPVAESGI